MPQYKEEYRRHLPHIIPLDGMFHVVFRTKGSIPTFVMQKLSEEFQEKKLNIVAKSRTERDKILFDLNREYFEEFENFLHQVKEGAFTDFRKASIVKNALFFHDGNKFSLVAFSIMPNHVHLLVMNVRQNLSFILKSIKGFSAYEINKLDAVHGPFWQDENYDHMIQSRNEMAETIKYFLNNPVKSGLCNHYSEHLFTWCNPKYLDL
jgi:putative transposase